MDIDISYDKVRTSNNELWVVSFLVSLISFILYCVGLWHVFVKAGRPGWAGIIPIYENIVLLDIVGKPCWWVFLYFIPVVNLIVHVIIMCHLGDCFDHQAGFKIGLIFFPIIFLLILGFNNSTYTDPSISEINYL